MSEKTYPYAFHRDAEHASDEFEAIHALVQVCIDSLKLANTCELSCTVSVLEMVRERAWFALEPTRKLQENLHKQWLDNIKNQEKMGAHS